MCPSRLFPCLDLKNNYFLPQPEEVALDDPGPFPFFLSSLFFLDNHFVYFSHLLLISGGSYGPPRGDCNQSCRAGGRRCPEQRSWRIGDRSETRVERSHDGWTMSDGLDSGATRANKNADVIITEGERSDASWLLPTARKQRNSSSVSELFCKTQRRDSRQVTRLLIHSVSHFQKSETLPGLLRFMVLTVKMKWTTNTRDNGQQ